MHYVFIPAFPNGFDSKTDSTIDDLYVFEYSQSEEASDVTVDGVTYAEKKTIIDTTGSAADTCPIVLDIEDYPTLDNLTADSTGLVDLGKIEVHADSKTGPLLYTGTVTYLKE